MWRARDDVTTCQGGSIRRSGPGHHAAGHREPEGGTGLGGRKSLVSGYCPQPTPGPYIVRHLWLKDWEAEVVEVELVEAICQRYHLTPAQARRQDACLIRHMAIVAAIADDTPPRAEFPVAPPPERELAAMSFALAGVD